MISPGVLPPLKKSQPITPKEKSSKLGEYIERSLKKIEDGCFRDGKLSIDDGYGDYRMSIFRFKDRKRRFSEKNSAFNSSFYKKMKNFEPELQAELTKIIECDNDEYLARKKKELEEMQSKEPPVAEWKGGDGEHLFYQYVPEYEKERWFRTSTQKPPSFENRKNNVSLLETKSVPKNSGRVKRKAHFFKFLEL